jgi:hypothetical protein
MPTSWTGPAGILCLDPANALVWLATLPISGDMQWNFAIPPGLPVDFWLGLQAVELSPAGVLGLTNLTTFAVW